MGASHEARRALDGAGLEPLTPESLWRRCTQLGQTGPDGVTLLDVADALTAVGQPALASWPYNGALGVGTEEPPTAVGPEPWMTAPFAEVPLAHDGVEDGLEAELAADTAIVLVVEVTDEFEYPGLNGRIGVPSIRAPVGGYHAVLVVGAADLPGGRHLLIRNSWGDSWGLGGYAWLPVEYLENFAVQAGVVGVSP